MPPNRKTWFHLEDTLQDFHAHSSPDTIRCAVLGCGMMGQEHISYITGYPNDIRIDFLCDVHEPSIAAAKQVWEKFQPISDSKASMPTIVRSEEELFLHASQIDLLVIATPNYLHTDSLVKWGKQNITILCEKPVAVNQQQLTRLRLLSQDPEFQARIWTAMEYRYIPAVSKLISLVNSNVIGDLKMITIRENRYPFLHKVDAWNRDPAKTGDTLVEKCCHFFDLFRLITGQEVSLPQVRAMAQRGLNYEDEPGTQQPIMDAAYVLMSFEDSNKENSNKRVQSTSTLGCLELCMYAEGSRHQEEIVATGTKGRVEAYLPQNEVYCFARPSMDSWADRSVPPPSNSIREEIFDCSDVRSIHGIEVSEELPSHSGYHYSSTAVEWYRLLSAIKTHSETGIFVSEVSLEDGMRAVEIGIQATSSLVNEQSSSKS